MLRDLRENRNGLVGHWLPAWETPALVDASGRGNTGTNNGSTIATSSRGAVRRFDGVDDNIIFSAPDVIAGSDTVATAGAWVFCTKGTVFPQNPLISIYQAPYVVNSSELIRIECRDWSGKSITVTFRSTSGGGSNKIVTYSNTKVYDGWVRIDATLNCVSGELKLYENGVLVGTETSIGNPKTTATDEITIARTEAFEGYISDISFYKRALPAAEIRELYQRTKSPPLPRRRVYSLPAAPPAGNRRRRLLIGSG